MKERTGGRLLIAGTGSGCGKTTVMCGLLYGLKQRGLRVASYKCGPDYIDPMFHREVLGIPSGNLDSFFTPEDVLCSVMDKSCWEADLTLIEGVMGYYDGIGMTARGSSHEIAEITGTPAVLVVNGRGMANSVGALLRGFLSYGKNGSSTIKGVVFNQISEKMYPKLAALAEREGIRPLGFLPHQSIFSMQSRHLGLIRPEEMRDFQNKLAGLYEIIKNTIDWKGLLELSKEADVSHRIIPGKTPAENGRVYRIGIARDEAFCFIYEDNLRYLREKNCELIFFSPLRDEKVPEEIDGLILYGGYPELYAKELSENRSMRRSVRNRIAGGLPCIAECGGYLYLQKELADEHGNRYEMAGVLPGSGKKGSGLKHFGYVEVGLNPDRTLFGKENICFRAHEFHYYDCESGRGDFTAVKASGEGSWQTGFASDTLYGGFPHIYYCGNETFVDAFLDQCAKYHRNKPQKAMANGEPDQGSTICDKTE